MRSTTTGLRFFLFALTWLLLHAPVPGIRAEDAGEGPHPTARFSLRVYPKTLEPGGVFMVTVEGADISGAYAEGSFGDQELIFHAENDGRGLSSLGGVDLEAKPGPVALAVFLRKGDGKTEVLRSDILVNAKEFALQKLYLEEKEYTTELLARIKREGDMFHSLWETVTPERLWRESFVRPLSSIRVTSDFGLRRLINDVPRKPHTGVDLRAAAGDTIFATNQGRVVLDKELYFSGRTIVLDHGEGLYSMYFHLSTPLVKEGEDVRRGEPIGLVGSTGRSTAPHLHWGITLRGVRLDPLKILDLPVYSKSNK